MLAACLPALLHQVGLIGEAVDLTYTYTHLGSDAAAISKLAAGGAFMDQLKAAKRPVVVVGPGILNRWGGGGLCPTDSQRVMAHDS